MIRRLGWDSDFFGYEVGQFIFNGRDWFDNEQAKKYHLIYILSENEIQNLPVNVQLVDIKTVFSKELDQSINIHAENIGFEVGSTDTEKLHSLAFQSGEWSRFKRDPGFVNGEFEKLYTEWIDKSIGKKIADRIIVSRGEEGKIIGFVTVKLEKYYGSIGLIAVDEKFRGKGIGRMLLDKASDFVKEHKKSILKVATQFSNEAAKKLYIKSGFSIEEKRFIYHQWNKV